MKSKAKYTKIEKARHTKKYKELRSSGFSSKDASKLSRGKTELSWDNIDKVIQYRGLTKVAMGQKVEAVRKNEERLAENKVYTARQYVTVLWMSFSGEVDFMTGQDLLKKWSTKKKKDMAKKIYDNAEEHDDSSGTSDGKAIVHYGSEQGCKDFIRQKVTNIHAENVQRRMQGEPMYNEYTIIIHPRNSFSAKGMSNLLAGVMAKCNDQSARYFYEDMHDYVKDNLPEIYKMIF